MIKVFLISFILVAASASAEKVTVYRCKATCVSNNESQFAMVENSPYYVRTSVASSPRIAFDHFQRHCEWLGGFLAKITRFSMEHRSENTSGSFDRRTQFRNREVTTYQYYESNQLKMSLELANETSCKLESIEESEIPVMYYSGSNYIGG